jgi:hypothetical protein
VQGQARVAELVPAATVQAVDGKEKLLSFGKCPSVSLAAARENRRDVRNP